jgi:nitrilase
MPRSVNVSLIQMCSSDDLNNNLQDAEQFIEQAANENADIIVLPEYFPFMGLKDRDKLQHQERFEQSPLKDKGDDHEQPIQTMLSRLAKKYGVWIVGGSIPVQSNDEQRPFARCLIYNTEGEAVGHYDKIHMFDVEVDDKHSRYCESAGTLPGKNPVVVETPWGKVGLSICYDLRFAELYRHYANQDVSLIFVPSAFTVPTGAAHWEVLLRARAIENQSFVIAAAQAGEHANGRKTWGHSMVVDPWGRIVGELQQQPGVLTLELDLDERTRLVQKMPVQQHRVL